MIKAKKSDREIKRKIVMGQADIHVKIRIWKVTQQNKGEKIVMEK